MEITTCYNRLIIVVSGKRRLLHLNGLIMAAMAGLILAGGASAAPKPQELTWSKLIPAGSGEPDYTRVSPVLQIIKGLMSDETKPPPVVASLDGQHVRLSGYVVPLKHEGTRVSEFLLVPYVGACIHVPPPPQNQIVHVTPNKPVKVKKLFAAVTVTGTMRIQLSTTELAETGYSITGGNVQPYQEYKRVREFNGHKPND